MRKPLIITALIMLVLLFPLQHQVIIDKQQIESNKPFAGTINNKLVGTELCIKYWLDKENQPEYAIYHVTYPFGLSLLGYVYNTELIFKY